MLVTTKEEFKATIDGSYWWHIRRKSLIPSDLSESKSIYLENLYDSIKSGSYFVKTPRGSVIEGKNDYVARVVPVLDVGDYCVYYYCIKELESFLAINRIENTYGGFSLGGKIREAENAEEVFEPPSTPIRAFNKFGWVKAWGEFQKRAWECATSRGATRILQFDIANFYDTIDLGLLETKVRHAVPNEKMKVVNLLFSFLKNWNRRVYGYGHQTKGLPQDEVGDCSRILANFFLQDYDAGISDYCAGLDIKYLRYADDQILMSNSKEDNLKALYEASILLHKQGLNINTSKVIEQTEEEFTTYWAFEIQDLLKDSHNRVNVREGVRKYFNWVSDLRITKSRFRWQTVFRRIVTCGLEDLPIDLQQKILSDCYNNAFLLSANSYYLGKIYSWLDVTEKMEFKNHLIELITICRFNKYLYELLNFDNAWHLFDEAEVKLIKHKIFLSSI